MAPCPSTAALKLSALSDVAIGADLARHPQHVWIMDVAWPVVALFAGLLALWLYFRYGRLASAEAKRTALDRGEDPPSKGTPLRSEGGHRRLHCRSGCRIGDVIAEWLALLAPTVAVWLGCKTLSGDET